MLYSVLSWINDFAYSHFIILSLSFRFCRSDIEYEIESMILLIRILSFNSFFLLSVKLVFNTKGRGTLSDEIGPSLESDFFLSVLSYQVSKV